MDQKGREEARHFWQEVDRGGKAPPLPTAAELFATQSTGINFSQYDKIPVTRGKVGADAVPPLARFADVARPARRDLG